jgi:tRNA/rRNA methyltransferase
MFDNVRFILVRTEEAGNAGAAARVLANFGFSDLVLVSPRMKRPEEAPKWARAATSILEGATRMDRLEDAVQDCAVAFATTRRRGKLRGAHSTPRDAGVRAASLAASGQRTAWVFGPESRGLPTEDVALCHARVTIPTAPGLASLNLAQAVAVCAYETYVASLAGTPPARRRTATAGERESLYRHVEDGLRAIGFLGDETAPARMAVLRRILERSDVSPDEVRYLRGIARQMAWAGNSLARTRKPD